MSIPCLFGSEYELLLCAHICIGRLVLFSSVDLSAPLAVMRVVRFPVMLVRMPNVLMFTVGGFRALCCCVIDLIPCGFLDFGF